MNKTYCRPGRSSRQCKYWWFDGWDWLVNRVLAISGSKKVKVNNNEIAIDPHIHTLFSHCSISQPELIILKAVKLGLHGIGIMDHNEVAGALDALACAENLKERGIIPEYFTVIPGTEISSKQGHIGALFITEKIRTGMTPADTVKAIRDAGGLAIAVHPFHTTGINDSIYEVEFDAIETCCGSVFGSKLIDRNNEIVNDPKFSNTAKIGSSDAHYCGAIASCYTVIQAEEPSPESIKDAILENRVYPISTKSALRIRKLLR